MDPGSVSTPVTQWWFPLSYTTVPVNHSLVCSGWSLGPQGKQGDLKININWKEGHLTPQTYVVSDRETNTWSKEERSVREGGVYRCVHVVYTCTRDPVSSPPVRQTDDGSSVCTHGPKCV